MHTICVLQVYSGQSRKVTFATRVKTPYNTTRQMSSVSAVKKTIILSVWWEQWVREMSIWTLILCEYRMKAMNPAVWRLVEIPMPISCDTLQRRWECSIRVPRNVSHRQMADIGHVLIAVKQWIGKCISQLASKAIQTLWQCSVQYHDSNTVTIVCVILWLWRWGGLPALFTRCYYIIVSRSLSVARSCF